MLNKIILIFILLSSLSHADWTCKKGELKYLSFKKGKTLKSEYCYNSDKTALISKSCLDKDCVKPIISKYKGKEKLVTSIGNPAFKYCAFIKGSPQILQFKADGKWWKLDRCILSEKNYVDTGYLFGEYLRSTQSK